MSTVPHEYMHTREYLPSSLQEPQGTMWELAGGGWGAETKISIIFSTSCGLRILKPLSMPLKPNHDPSDKCHMHLQTCAHPTCAHVCALVCTSPLSTSPVLPEPPRRLFSKVSNLLSFSILHVREPWPRDT